MSAPSDRRIERFLARLERIGEAAVRQNIAKRVYEETQLPHVHAFLDLKRRERDDAARRAGLEQGAELVGHADNANRIARRANFIAATALIVSVGALIASLIALRG